MDLPNLQATADTASKPAWKSKTMIAGAVTALLPFIPGVGPVVTAWVAANPEAFSAALGVLFSVLRVVSKDKVVVK
jgi:hypothetical protein